MINYNAFILSHTSMPAMIPEQGEIDSFLPDYKPGWKLDVNNPITFGNIIGPDGYEKIRKDMQESHKNAKKLIIDITKQWEKEFGRYHGDLIEKYYCEDAEYILLSMGAIGAESKISIDNLRSYGIKIGLARIRTIRPFPKDAVLELSKKADLIIIDRNISLGLEGVLFSEVKSSLYGKSDSKVYGFIAGLGGKDVTFWDIEKICRKVINGNAKEYEWYGLEEGEI
jgi:pyruvate/2-oxoacid:ferredoxin oxidoreductase alpha subunit